MVDKEDTNQTTFDDEFESFDAETIQEQQGVTLSDVWNNNPAFKLFIIVAVIGLVVIGILLVTSGDNDDLRARAGSASSVNEAPGTAEVSPAYEAAIREETQERIENALVTGDSALPTPIARSEDRLEAPAEQDLEDPLEQWRREAERRRVERERERMEALEQEPLPELEPLAIDAPSEPPVLETIPELPLQQRAPQQFNQQEAITGPDPEMVQALTENIGAQVQVVLEKQIPQPSFLTAQDPSALRQIVDNRINPPEANRRTSAQAPAATSTRGGRATVAAQQTGETLDAFEEPQPALIPAGEIEYAQMLTAANSDVPGPVLATIASGPLAGGRAIGSFSNTDEFLTIQFNLVTLNGFEYPINAIAIDPATTLPGMATEVKNHYLIRVAFPAAARFLEGFARAVADSGSTTVTVNNETVTTETDDLDTEEELLAGAEEGIGEIADIIDDEGDIEPTVIVAPGTRFGLLFLDSIFEDDI